MTLNDRKQICYAMTLSFGGQNNEYENTPIAFGCRFADSADLCGAGDCGHIAMHDDGYYSKPDEYVRPNLYVHSLGDDHRTLDVGVYARDT